MADGCRPPSVLPLPFTHLCQGSDYPFVSQVVQQAIRLPSYPPPPAPSTWHDAQTFGTGISWSWFGYLAPYNANTTTQLAAGWCAASAYECNQLCANAQDYAPASASSGGFCKYGSFNAATGQCYAYAAPPSGTVSMPAWPVQVRGEG